MLRSMAIAATIMVLSAGAAIAADLTDGDYRLLSADFGLRQEGWMLKDMTAVERSELHRIINDPQFAEFPKVRSYNAADYLYQVHIRECKSWSQSQSASQKCPSSGDQTVDLGQDLAERHCNFCHLFGTPSAPSFHKLAVRGDVTEPRLADALAQGHQMSPIGLEPQEIHALSAYIASLK